MKLGILLLVTGGKALKDNSEFEQSGAIAEDIFITEGKSLNPTTTQSFENPNQKSYNDQNLTIQKIFLGMFNSKIKFNINIGNLVLG